MRTYLDHLAVERGLAANTLASYRRDLRRYLGVPGRPRRRRPRTAVTEADVTRVPGRACARATRTTRRWRADSAARAVVAVRGFHRFALREGLATVDPPRGGPAAGAGQAAAQGDPAGRRRGAARRPPGADEHAAGAAGPGAAGAALRHRRADLRGGRARRRRPRPRRAGHGAAARQGQQGADRAGRLATPARRSSAYLVRGRPALAAARHAGRRRCSSTPAAAGCPGRAPGPCCARPPSGPG